MDDILIYLMSIEEHKTLKDCFTNSIDALPILEGVFLGHVVLVARIVVDLAKVEAVLRWK